MCVKPEKNILEHFCTKNAVMIMSLTDQSYYSVCHLLVRIFILTVPVKYWLTQVAKISRFI